MPKSIKIRDKRKIDSVTGKPVSDKSRFHADVSSDYVEKVIKSAKKYGNDPYTALAMNLAETGLKTSYNPFMISLDQYNPYGDAVDQAMKILSEKKKLATRLGKTSEEDIIQAWNGYGTIKNQGKMYGIDTSANPINMKENPVYGKRVVNLRDSVIKTNPEIVKLVDKYQDGGVIKQRKDFKGNILSRIAKRTGPIPKSSVISDELFDYWSGQTIRNNNLSYSKYRPTDETNPNSIYIAWKDPEFEKEVVQYYKENYKGKTLKPSYTYKSKETGERFNKFKSLGNFRISGGKDEKGEFVQYYDVYDFNKGKPNLNKTEKLGAGKPFEVYDRIYLNEENKRHGGTLNNTPMKKTNKNRYRIVDLYDGEMYDLGGWLGENKNALLGTGSGALSGAVAGSAFGPIGTAVGGLIGGVSGLFGGNAEDEEQAELERQNALRERYAQLSAPRTVGSANMTPNVMSFEKGGNTKVAKVMNEFKKGKLHSGSKKGPVVKKRKQAIAIALSEAGLSKYQNGGDMMNQDLIELEGPLHEQGGIQFTPDAELEGGETVYNDIVNSDSIKITKELAEQYGLPKKAINKTIAEYSKIVNNKYKDRDVDPFAMKSKEIELSNLSKMSEEIAELYKREGNEYQIGGKYKEKNPENWYNRPYRALWEMAQEIPFNMNRMDERNMLRRESRVAPEEEYNPATIVNNMPNGYYLPEVNVTGKINTGLIKQVPTSDFNIRQEVKPKSYPQNLGYISEGASKINLPAVSKPLAGLQKNYQGAMPFEINDFGITGTNDISTSKGMNKGAKTGEGLNNVLGLAPLAAGAIQTLSTALNKPEKVKLGRLQYNPIHPEFIDPSYQLRNVEDVFGTANQQMEQQSKKDYLRRRIQSATEESKAKSGVLGQASAANADISNRVRQINLQGKLQTDAANLQTGMYEENINAANRGAWQTARDYQFANLATMTGEYARDRRLESANKEYNERTLNVLNDIGKGAGVQYDDMSRMTRTPIGGYAANDIIINSPSTEWYYNNKDATYDNVDIGGGINNYSRSVARSTNPTGYRSGNFYLPGLNFNR
jgi:hypothetical protein